MMLSSKYGDRYLTVDEFIRFCEDVNLGLDRFHEREQLERYEEAGVLLPAARLVVPNEYVIRRPERPSSSLRRESEVNVTEPPSDWEQLERVLYGAHSEEYGDERDAWHHLDAELENRNPFLTRPALGTFRPWQSYKANVGPVSNGDLVDTAIHYYHYWQVYQVYLLKKEYPIFSEHPNVIRHLVRCADSSGVREYAEKFWPNPDDSASTVNGMVQGFDALSFYIQLYQAEQDFAFDSDKAIEGWITIGGVALEQHKLRLVAHAKSVLRRHGLDDTPLYEFLVKALHLLDEIETDERVKLSEVLSEDLGYLQNLIADGTGRSSDEIAQEVTKRGGPFVGKQFRHLDKEAEVFDYAQEMFETMIPEYNKDFPALSMSQSEVEKFMNFFKETGIFIIPDTIFSTDEALNSHRSFWSPSLYAGMRNLATGTEVFLREIAGRIPNKQVNKDSLYNLLQIFVWYKDLRKAQERIRKGKRPSTPEEFIRLVRYALSDHLLDPEPHIRHFLVLYWIRNLTGHHYTLSEELFHSSLYGKVFSGIQKALLYTWAYARQQGWVK